MRQPFGLTIMQPTNTLFAPCAMHQVLPWPVICRQGANLAASRKNPFVGALKIALIFPVGGEFQTSGEYSFRAIPEPAITAGIV
jgi:hypothetical protein